MGMTQPTDQVKNDAASPDSRIAAVRGVPHYGLSARRRTSR